MNKKNNLQFWVSWLIASVAIALFFTYLLMSEGVTKTLFMPGDLSPGHHQLVDACDTCHTSAFGGDEILQDACISCHGDDRVKPNDSHPRSKFKDPRNADTLEKINATHCVSCHVEHKPEITLKDGLTQPRDVCFHCHAEIAQERPSHEGMSFMTCKDSGCHNFHNNRALYTDFLVKHMDDPFHKNNATLPAKEFFDVLDEILEYPRDKYPVQALSIEEIDAPKDKHYDEAIIHDWSTTAHAASGVNCSACHISITEKTQVAVWNDSPNMDSCNQCHNHEVNRFKLGKHGMRLQAGLSAMTPAQALLPMHSDASHKELTCNSCHGAHNYDVSYAAVDGCLQCHADDHSLAYKDSKHYALWIQEQTSNDNKHENQGVSCASCHMPRIDYDVSEWTTRKLVDHNQSANLSPNSKMIRSSCLHCHGLGFAIDSLADEDLIKNNFNGLSKVKVESIDLARKDLERYLQEKQDAE